MRYALRPKGFDLFSNYISYTTVGDRFLYLWGDKAFFRADFLLAIQDFSPFRSGLYTKYKELNMFGKSYTQLLENKYRIFWLDYVKFFCIMFVMLSHLESNTNILSAFYQPFFLFGFFFVSGYVYKKHNSFKELIIKKAKTLLFPWLIFSIINIVASQIFSFNEHDSFLSELFWNFAQIRGKDDQLWFLTALFVAFIPFFLIAKFYYSTKFSEKARIWIVTISTFSLSTLSILYSKLANPNWFFWNSTALPWHIEYIFQAVFFMWLGLLFKTTLEKYFDKLKLSFSILILGIIYLLVITSNLHQLWEST